MIVGFAVRRFTWLYWMLAAQCACRFMGGLNELHLEVVGFRLARVIEGMV
jgi:hypothetical protein